LTLKVHILLDKIRLLIIQQMRYSTIPNISQ